MNAALRCGLVASAALFWAGCSESKDGPDDGNAGRAGSAAAGTAGKGGTGAGATGGSGGGGAGAGGSAGDEDPGPPLLERPAEIAYDCEVTRSMALLELNPWVGGGLHPNADDTATLTRIEGGGGLAGTTRKVSWSSLGFDGALGAVHALPLVGAGYLGQLTTRQVDDRISFLWSESLNGEAQLIFASVDASGEVVVPSHALTSGAAQRLSPLLAPAGDGYLVVWTRQSTGGAGGNAIELQRVGADGKASGDVRVLLEATGMLQSTELVAQGSGFALLFSQVDYATDTQGTYYLRLDESGAPQGEPLKLGTGTGSTSSVARGDELLVAWTDAQGSFDSKRSVTIRVGAIDASGARRGPSYALQAPVVDTQNVDPHWVSMGDDVGLFWSQGSVIYICGGCFPDNELRFVVLDGKDLTRKSEVLELPSPIAFGLLSPLALRAEDEILTIASATHHTDAEGASATIRCTP